jgi:hypothetical protein
MSSKLNGKVARSERLCVPGLTPVWEPKDRAAVIHDTVVILEHHTPTPTPEQREVLDRFRSGALLREDWIILTEIMDEAPLTGAQRRVIEHGLRFATYGTSSPTPQIPADLAERIATGAAEKQASALIMDEKLAEVCRLENARMRAKGGPERLRLAEAIRASRDEYERARDAHQRAIVALNRIYQELDGRRRAEALAQ